MRIRQPYVEESRKLRWEESRIKVGTRDFPGRTLRKERALVRVRTERVRCVL